VGSAGRRAALPSGRARTRLRRIAQLRIALPCPPIQIHELIKANMGDLCKGRACASTNGASGTDGAVH
jgi:hypothetical protein